MKQTSAEQRQPLADSQRTRDFRLSSWIFNTWYH